MNNLLRHFLFLLLVPFLLLPLIPILIIFPLVMPPLLVLSPGLLLLAVLIGVGGYSNNNTKHTL